MTSIVAKKVISKNPQVISKWARHKDPDFWTRKSNPAIEKSRSRKESHFEKTPSHFEMSLP